tara:strand:+ start:396 stop:728 length:333 start_codon:yes stop_codon:yes gene_type:complete
MLDSLAEDVDPIACKDQGKPKLMEQFSIESLIQSKEDLALTDSPNESVSVEVEMPEVLFQGMKDFVSSNEDCDQFRVVSSALASFLFQNGCQDRAVTERYLNDLFKRSEN